MATVKLTPATFRSQLAAYRDPDGRFREGTLFRLAPGQLPPERRTLTPRPSVATARIRPRPSPPRWDLKIAGRGIVFVGDDPDEAVIRTNAGYGPLRGLRGLRLRASPSPAGCAIRSAHATDAAIVERSSSLRVEDCLIRDNLGDSTVVANVVGIIGVAGREGAISTMRGNRILRNSWDGIALYRGAQATIEDNLIDGVDKARGREVGGGRGVGIGVTWNADATIRATW